MADTEDWQAVLKRIDEVAQRIRATPLEQRSGEALIEIVGQLIEMNQGIADLTEAVYAVVDAPRQ